MIVEDAASFTPTELEWPSTWVDRNGHDRRPVIPSHEVSGVVAALGYGTTGVSVGDAVYGLTDWYRNGAAADYVAVEARNLSAKSAAFDHETAATVPMAALTSVQALFDHGRLVRGQTLLITGAAGGVGVFAIQVAHRAGARVVAVARARSRDLVRELGADVFVDADRDPLEEAVKGADLVFDLVGGDSLTRAWSALREGGALVSIVDQPKNDAASRGKRGVFFVVEPNRAQLAEAGERITRGELRALVGARVPLTEGAAAFSSKQRGGISGKSVLRVAEL